MTYSERSHRRRPRSRPRSRRARSPWRVQPKHRQLVDTRR
jgi:hypothetical protein